MAIAPHQSTISSCLQEYGTQLAPASFVRKQIQLKNELKTQDAAHKILRYLMDNPKAKDTLEGIVEWWLLQQNIKQSITLIRGAVDKLIQKGFLVETQGTGRTTYYQVNNEKLPEIAALIQNA